MTAEPVVGTQTVLERIYRASLRDVWELWTTKPGFESWWGPGGFAVTVKEIDVRPGGRLLYDMTAVDRPQVEYMRKAGMPLTTEARLRFTEVVPERRLAFQSVVDFIPGVQPYNVAHLVELYRVGKDHVRMVLSMDAMHSEEWTERARAGWEGQLTKLDTRFTP
jgi:uncharacterized protein YndB with AHSA1/START domain